MSRARCSGVSRTLEPPAGVWPAIALDASSRSAVIRATRAGVALGQVVCFQRIASQVEQLGGLVRVQDQLVAARQPAAQRLTPEIALEGNGVIAAGLAAAQPHEAVADERRIRGDARQFTERGREIDVAHGLRHTPAFRQRRRADDQRDVH